MAITPLEDLLKSRRASTRAHSQLYQELRRLMPTRDADVWAWHLTLPYRRPQVDKGIRRHKYQILPQFDTLMCLHCNTSLDIPLEKLRFDEDTFRAYREVFHTPSLAQECACKNLKTLTGFDKNPRIYLEDADMQAFSFYHGPINLRAAEGYSHPYDVRALLDSERPQTSDPVHLEVRENQWLNHINFYGCSQHTFNLLLPYEDPKAYSRAFNIVIFAPTTIIFPSGHELEYKYFKIPDIYALRRTKYTEKHTLELNLLASSLFFDQLPQVLDEIHHNYANKLAKFLGIHRSYQPLVPHRNYWPRWRPHRDSQGFPNPLSYYSEVASLRLPYYIKVPRGIVGANQEFTSRSLTGPKEQAYNRPLATSSQNLKFLKRERVKLLQYILPRFEQSPHISKRLIQDLKFTTLPPHTPINHTTSLTPENLPLPR